MSTRSSRHSRMNRERIDDTATEEKQPLSTVRRRDDEDHGGLLSVLLVLRPRRRRWPAATLETYMSCAPHLLIA